MERAQAERTSQPTRTQQHPCYCLRRSGPRQIWACIAVVLLSTSSTACYAFGMLRPALYTSTAISTTTTVASRGDRCAWPASLREIRSSGLSSVAGHCAVFVGCGGLVATNRDTLHHRAEVYKLYMSSIEVVASGDRRTVDVGGETNPIGAFRKPRGNDLRRDDSGLPVEKVYAPRASHYGRPTRGGTGRTKIVRPQGEDREVSINNAARLKVAGGVVKGRRLESPDVFLRPMMGKVKEALFNTLMGFGVFETGDARVLDLFSGSGSVGIEALSRGAGHATFVDLAKDCCEVCLRNANICGFDAQAKAVRGDVMDVLYNPRKYGLDTPFDVVTVTPPYEEVVYADLIKALSESDLVAQDTIVVIEYPVELGCLPHAIGDGTLVGLRNRRYGRTVLGLWVYLPSGQHGDMLDSRPEEFVTIKKRSRR